mgnify:CR=1 FL=1
MRTIFTILILCVILPACQRDEDALNDYHLFGRLQARGGTWKVERYEVNDNSTIEPDIIITEPDNDFFHFYRQSKLVFNNLIDIATIDIFINDKLAESHTIAAERERVIFEALQPTTGTVWTVESNKPNSQIWVKTDGVETMRLYLRRCNCEIPHSTSEIEG